MAGVWTDAAVDALKRYWLQGLSCAEIARLIKHDTGVTVTRNAVIGKRIRVGLPDRWNKPSVDKQDTLFGPPGPKPKRRPPRNAANYRDKDFQAQKAPPPLPSETPPETARPWGSRKSRECQWIYGDPHADALTCCAPTERGAPYCPSHARLIYQPGRVKDRVDARLSIPAFRKSA